MKSTAKVMFKILLSYWKRSVSFICLIALLATAAGLLGKIFLSEETALSPVNIVIVNHDKGRETSTFLRELYSEAAESQVINIAECTANEGMALLENGEISAMFIVPEGFLTSVLSGENLSIEAIYNPHFPIQTLLMNTAAGELLELLESSQTGIYTSLSYTKKHAPEQYDRAYLKVNARYIKNTMAFQKVTKGEIVSSVGQGSFFAHYVSGAVLTLLMLGCCLYTPLVRSSFSLEKRKRMGTMHISNPKISGGIVVGWWMNYMLMGLLGFVLYVFTAVFNGRSVSPLIVIGIMATTLFTAVFGTFISLAFSESVGNFIVVVYSVLNLIFSGGILPLALFDSGLRGLSRFFPAYYGVEMIKGTIAGNLSLFHFGFLLLFTAMFFLLSCLFAKRKEVV